MTDVADLIEETRSLLYSGDEPESNVLTNAIDEDATSLTFDYSLGNISRGAIISLGLEDIRVLATSSTNMASVVVRGVNGTTPAAHDEGDTVWVRPKFSDFRILQALNADLGDLSSPSNGLFKVESIDITYNPAVQGYNLTGATDVIRLLELRWKQAGPSRVWPLIRKYDLTRSMDDDEFASTFAVFLREPAYPGLPVRVRYAAPFTPMVALDDDVVEDVGLPATAVDLPPLGAIRKLVAAREINRNFTEAQSNPRRADEVPPGAVMQSMMGLQQVRRDRITAEAARLQAAWSIFS